MKTFTDENGTEYRFYDKACVVTQDGRVFRWRKTYGDFRPISPHRRPDGYLIHGKRLVHRMVATCWLPKEPDKPHVHHKDGDKTNNHVDNLEWVSPQKHMTDHHPDVVDRFTRYERTEAHKQRLRELRLGTKTSEATKQKQREANLRLGLRPPVQYGRKMSESNKAKLREARQQSCEVDGVRYASFTEAGRARGERPLTLRKRCLSPNFSNYRVL